MEIIQLISAKILTWVMVIMGLSFIFASAHWVTFLNSQRESRYGSLAKAAVLLPFGLFLVITHNIWDINPFILVTILSWLILLIGIIHLISPWFGSNILRAINGNIRAVIKIVGLILFIIGIILVYILHFPI